MTRPTKFGRYQDYVIRDGKLVGEFEEMYRDFDDPWEQQSERDATDKAIGVALLRKNGHQRALEYGCGLGQYTDQLHHHLGAAAGVDISPTAIAKARERYPAPSFLVGGILGDAPLAEFRPDVLVFSQVTWLVLGDLAAFKKCLRRQSARGFLHLLHVYPPGVQKYGTDYFVDLEGILRYWSDVIDFVEWGEVRRTDDAGGARTFFYGTIKSIGRAI